MMVEVIVAKGKYFCQDEKDNVFVLKDGGLYKQLVTVQDLFNELKIRNYVSD